MALIVDRNDGSHQAKTLDSCDVNRRYLLKIASCALVSADWLRQRPAVELLESAVHIHAVALRTRFMITPWNVAACGTQSHVVVAVVLRASP